jgi:hypothetical protein
VKTRVTIDLERLAQNVADGEHRIAVQENLLQRLRIAGKPTHEAELILQEMQDLLRTMRGLLADMRNAVEAGLLSGPDVAPLEREDDDGT